MKYIKHQSGRVLRTIVLIILGMAAVSYCTRSSYVQTKSADEMVSQTSVAKSAPQIAPVPVVKAWRYDQSEDEMTSAITNYAMLDSRDLIQLDRPYHGYNQPGLTIRKSKKKGYSVLYSITKGQILCRDCLVQVRFDDNPSVTFSGGGSSSMDTELLFITPAKKFVDLMKKSKTVKIEVNIYRKGNIVSVFDVAGFEDR